MTKRAQRTDGNTADNQPLPRMTRPAAEAKTWGEIKAMIEAQGVTDEDLVFMVDIGPDLGEVFVSRDYMGQIEITDGPAPAAPECGPSQPLRLVPKG